VVSRHCNQRCGHCYNDSEPGARGLSPEQVTLCVARLPDPDDVPVERIIISGGEVLAWPELLFHTLARLDERYGARAALWVQTNGDLLDEASVWTIARAPRAARRPCRAWIAITPSRPWSAATPWNGCFASRGMLEATDAPADRGQLLYGFWGATADQWIGPLWPRAARVRTGSRPRDRSTSSAGCGAVRRTSSSIVVRARR